MGAEGNDFSCLVFIRKSPNAERRGGALAGRPSVRTSRLPGAVRGAGGVPAAGLVGGRARRAGVPRQRQRGRARGGGPRVARGQPPP